MSRTACCLGKSLANTINHSDQAKAFRVSTQESNGFVDARSNSQYEYFQSYDTPYRFLDTDELQDDDLLALDFASTSNISDKYNSFYFNDTEEEKRRVYRQEGIKYTRLDTDIMSQQFCEMQIRADSFYDVELKEVEFESSRSPDGTTPRISVPSLLEKLAGITKAEMVYMLEKNRLKYEILAKCNASASSD
ncbi:hypothetical protein HPULCUR_001189 [Helicostylum pulchrum]|uniref:Uncharacterized protein n=1 Tax=Helicostylum pulchrum TaxID=562976 RepID=A0ABP9XM09_9FUNG